MWSGGSFANMNFPRSAAAATDSLPWLLPLPTSWLGGVAIVGIVGVIPNNSSADDFDGICGCCMEVDGSCELTSVTVGMTPWSCCTCFKCSSSTEFNSWLRRSG